jgi:hypothetical protein
MVEMMSLNTSGIANSLFPGTISIERDGRKTALASPRLSKDKKSGVLEKPTNATCCTHGLVVTGLRNSQAGGSTNVDRQTRTNVMTSASAGNTSVSIETGAAMTRRRIFAASRPLILSASAIALLGGREALAAKLGCEADHPKDVQALNVMRALELEGVGVYQVAAESGLVSPDTLKVAVLFQTQHREHAQTLADAIKKIGGSPVDPKSATEYAKVVTAAGPKNEGDVIALASMLEKGAASAYIGTIPSLTDPLLAQLAAKIAADEVMHFTALQGALKRPMPEKSLSFGA